MGRDSGGTEGHGERVSVCGRLARKVEAKGGKRSDEGIVWGTDGEPGGYSLFRALLPPVPYGVRKYAIRATEPYIASKYEASARFTIRCAAAAGHPVAAICSPIRPPLAGWSPFSTET